LGEKMIRGKENGENARGMEERVKEKEKMGSKG
jgi:hypothetical protein